MLFEEWMLGERSRIFRFLNSDVPEERLLRPVARHQHDAGGRMNGW
jgi:hypothetical protein